MNYKNKLIAVIFISIAVFFLIFKPNLNFIDKKVDNFINLSLKETFISYAIIRSINAGVSVIKHSQIDIQPAGLGISIGAGEILDPIDDLTERVSNLLFIFIIIFGALKIIFNLSTEIFYIFFPIALALFSFGFLFKKYQPKFFYFGKILFLISIIKFLFIFIVLGNKFIDTHFQKEIKTVQTQLKISIPNNTKFSIPKTSGSIFDILKTKINYVKSQVHNFQKTMNILQKNFSSIINNLIKLAYLYFGILITDIIFIPFLIYIILKQSFNILYKS